MRESGLKRLVKTRAFRNAMKEEHGQDMVEYALVMGLIALGATAALGGMAASIAAAFTTVTGNVTTYTT